VQNAKVNGSVFSYWGFRESRLSEEEGILEWKASKTRVKVERVNGLVINLRLRFGFR
jgi:hypothetical protein